MGGAIKGHKCPNCLYFIGKENIKGHFFCSNCDAELKSNHIKVLVVVIFIGLAMLPVLLNYMPALISLIGLQGKNYILVKVLIAIFYGALYCLANNFFSKLTMFSDKS